MAEVETITMEDLEQEQAALKVLAGQFETTRDPDRMAQLSALVAEQVARLEAMAATFEREQCGKYGRTPEEFNSPRPLPGKVEVVLTPDQRERVRRLTGGDPETILIDDPTGFKTKRMRHMSPFQVELLAVESVLARRQAREARERSREAVQEIVAQIEAADDSPERREAIEKLRRDPAFLGGLLHGSPPDGDGG